MSTPLFKKNLRFNSEEVMFFVALGEAGSLDNLYSIFSDFEEDLTIIIAQFTQKLSPDKDIEDLALASLQYFANHSEKDDLIEKQLYEKAAELRDYERRFLDNTFGYEKGLGIPNSREATFIEHFRQYLVFKDKLITENSEISLLIQPGTATPKQIGKLLSELSLLYRMLGGSGITFKLDGVKSPKYTFDYE